MRFDQVYFMAIDQAHVMAIDQLHVMAIDQLHVMAAYGGRVRGVLPIAKMKRAPRQPVE